MKYTIYQITNTINGKTYIGKHQTTDINDSYFGSGRAIKEAIVKHGKENFIKEILFIFDTEEGMNAKEQELITEEFVNRRDTYNLGIGGEGGPHFKGKTHGSYMKKINSSEEHRKKVAEGLKRAYSNGHTVWNKGKKLDAEYKQKISKVRTGKKHSLETIEKIKAARKKQVFSEETKRKMSESAKNRKSNTSGPVA
jgi:hypothetical protein